MLRDINVHIEAIKVRRLPLDLGQNGLVSHELMNKGTGHHVYVFASICRHLKAEMT